MPAVVCITVEETDNGIAINQFALRKGSEIEDKVMSILDIGLRLAGEAVNREAGTGEIVEGKNIERIVQKQLDSIGGFNLKAALQKAGYELP